MDFVNRCMVDGYDFSFIDQQKPVVMSMCVIWTQSKGVISLPSLSSSSTTTTIKKPITTTTTTTATDDIEIPCHMHTHILFDDRFIIWNAIVSD